MTEDPKFAEYEVVEQMKQLDQDIERRLTDLEAEFPKNRETRRYLIHLNSVLIVGLAIFCGVLFGGLAGWWDLSTIQPTAAQQGTGAAGQETTQVSVADLLGVFLPALLLVVAFFVGTTGLKRLELYDNELRENRRERREEMNALRTELNRNLKSRTDEAAKVAMESAAQVARKIVMDLESTMNSLNLELTSTRESVGETEENLRLAVKQYGWLFKGPATKDVLGEGGVGSMGELHQVITSLFHDEDNVDSRRAAKELVERYFPDWMSLPDLRGTPDDFFNSASQLARENLEPLAHRVCEGGLKFFPNNPDLLSNAIKFASDSGLNERARELFDRAQSMPPDTKNWRMWIFLGHYIQNSGTSQEIFDFYNGYVLRFFDDAGILKKEQPKDAMIERVFAAFAGYLVRMDRVEEATQICLLATKHIERTPQTGRTFAAIRLEQGLFQEAITIANKALRDDARDDTNVNSASILMVKANAYEGLCFDACEKGELEEAVEFARLSLLNYERCITSQDVLDVFKITSVLRANAIVGRLQEVRVPAGAISSILPGVFSQVVGQTSDEKEISQSPVAVLPHLLTEILGVVEEIKNSPLEARFEKIKDFVKQTKEHEREHEALVVLRSVIKKFESSPDLGDELRITEQLLAEFR